MALFGLLGDQGNSTSTPTPRSDGGLLGWLGIGSYDPAAAYEGLLSSDATKDALRARSLASIAQAFGAGAGSDARGSAIPFGATMGNAAAAAYTGQDALIKARLEDAQQQQAVAGAQFATQRAGAVKDLIPIMKLAMGVDPSEIEAGEKKPPPLSPAALIASQRAGGGGSVDADPNVANHNFAGLRNPNEPAAGGPRENPKGWQTFPTPEAGVAAVDSQIQRYASGATTGKPINTLAGIITTWAPPTDNNDTAGLIARASKITGFAPDQPLDLADPTTRAKVTEALIRGEHGDKVPSAVTPEVMAKAHGLPAPHTFAPPVAARDAGVTPAEANIYRQVPGTIQNARQAGEAPFWTSARPVGQMGAEPMPSGGPPRGLLDLPEVPSYGGALGEGAVPRAPVPGQGAALAPQGAPTSLLAQTDPVTQRTVNAIAAAGPGRGAPGVNAAAAGEGVGGLLAQGAMAGAPPPVDPRLAARAAQVAGPGAPSDAAGTTPGLLTPGGSLQRTIDQNAGATVRPMPPPDSTPGQRLALPPNLLQQPPAAPTAPVAPAAPAPVPTAPAAPGAPAPVAGTPTARQIAASRYLTAVMPMLGLGAAPEWAQQNAAFPLVGPTEAAKKQAGVGPQMQIDAAQQFQQMQREIILQQLKTSTETVEVPVADANGRYVGKTVMTRDKAAEYLNRSGQGAAGGPAAPGARLPPVEPYLSPGEQAEQRGTGEALAGEYKQVIADEQVAQKSRPYLLSIQQALQTFNTPGAGEDAKLNAMKALQSALGTAGIPLSPALKDWIASGEVVKKSGNFLGFELARTLGAHEAANIVNQAVQNNPGIGTTLAGNKQLIALMNSILDRNEAKRAFYDDYAADTKRGNGSFRGAATAFNRANPWEVTVSQHAPYQLGPGKTDQAEYKKLPNGVKVIAPDGRSWIKGEE